MYWKHYEIEGLFGSLTIVLCFHTLLSSLPTFAILLGLRAFEIVVCWRIVGRMFQIVHVFRSVFSTLLVFDILLWFYGLCRTLQTFALMDCYCHVFSHIANVEHICYISNHTFAKTDFEFIHIYAELLCANSPICIVLLMPSQNGFGQSAEFELQWLLHV